MGSGISGELKVSQMSPGATVIYIIQVQKGKNREDQPVVNEDLGNTPTFVLVLIFIHRLTNCINLQAPSFQ